MRRLCAGAAALIGAWAAARRARATRRLLLGLSDHMLRDLGLTREQIARISRGQDPQSFFRR